MNTMNRHRPQDRAALDQQWNNFFNGIFGNEAVAKTRVAMDIAETDDHFRVEVDLPGITMDDIELSFHDQVLALQVQKTVNVEEKDGLTWHRRDRTRQKIQESLRFPVAVDANGIEASLSEGVLTISLPKAAEAKPKTIQIK